MSLNIYVNIEKKAGFFSILISLLSFPFYSFAQSQDTTRSDILELTFFQDNNFFLDSSSTTTDIPVKVSFKIKHYKKLAEIRYTFSDSNNNFIFADTSVIEAIEEKYFNTLENTSYEIENYSINMVFLVPSSDFELLRRVDVAVVEGNNSNKKDKFHKIKKY